MLFFTPVQPLLFIVSLGILILLVLWSCATAQWRALFAVDYRWRLWVLAVCFLGLLWGFIGINIEASFRIHPILITSVSSIFGFRLSLLAGCLSIWLASLLSFGELSQNPTLFMNFSDHLLWHNYAINCLVGVAVPAGVCTLALQVISRIRHQNLFIYTLGGGFLGGMLAMLGTGLASVAISAGFNEPSYFLLAENKHLFLLLMFPEGFCNGAIVSTLAVMAPHLVKTYDHDFYLK